jgi:hypothetical protein
MVDKIAKFKQALRAKTYAKKNPSTEETAFEKEMQKYKLDNKKQEQKKEQSPKAHATNTDKKAHDAHSKTAKPPDTKRYAMICLPKRRLIVC